VAYDEELAKKIADVLAEHGDLDERKIFGGIAFMVKGHMCCGVINEDLVLRLGPEGAAEALDDAHVRPMDFTGRPMKGYVYVAKEGVRTEAKIRKRIQAALDFVATLTAK
jgi:TfoX/Sxy family transcriptional regulator of competence genes